MKESCYCAQHCVRAILELFIHSLKKLTNATSGKNEELNSRG